MSYYRATAKKACACGGDLIWASWGADCRGNDAGYHILCDKCKRTYKREEVEHLKWK